MPKWIFQKISRDQQGERQIMCGSNFYVSDVNTAIVYCQVHKKIYYYLSKRSRLLTDRKAKRNTLNPVLYEW